MSSCLSPYDVKVPDYDELLVVDGLLTNENKTHTIRLTRSIPQIGVTPKFETDAEVIISEVGGVDELLRESSPGVYETDSTIFIANIGSTYILKIKTKNGSIYESDECLILPPTQINDVYFDKDKAWNADNSEELEGVSVYVESEMPQDSYVRWTYSEDWKFRAKYVDVPIFDENKEWDFVRVENDFCWKHLRSNSIVVHTTKDMVDAQSLHKKVCFLQSVGSDRFDIRHSLFIRQMTISKQEYNFWRKLGISSGEVGDIFGTQPFLITGNVKCISDSKESVLGYFKTGSIASKRIYIGPSNLVDLDVNFGMQSYCQVDTVRLHETYYDSYYSMFIDKAKNERITLSDFVLSDSDDILGAIYVKAECTDCSLTGSTKKPKFWED